MFDEVFTSLTIRPLTQQLVTRLLFDMALTPAMIVDFGVESDAHYRALKEVLFGEGEQEFPDQDEEESSKDDRALPILRERILALDAAIGNGEMLNALVKQYAPQYAERVQFCTSMDSISGRTKPLE